MAALNFPTGPTNGQVYGNYYWDSSSNMWRLSQTPTAVYVSTTAPSSPSNGTLWFNSETAIMYIYYADGTSNQWVEVGNKAAVIGNTVSGNLAVSGGITTGSAIGIAYGGTGGDSAVTARQNLGISVVQTVATLKTTSFSTTSTTPVDVTGVSATITPTSSNNKVLVRVLGYGAHNNTSYPPQLRILRDSTVIPTGTTYSGVPYNGSDTSGGGTFAYEFIDTPATTSATTYKLQVSSGNSAGTVYVGRYVASNTVSITSILVSEIQV